MRYFDDCMTLDELRRKYKEWVVKLHPDRHTQDSPEERAQAERDFKDMSAQYECREAELKGDYSKSRKYQQETERERREREERERKEQARRRVERVVEEARRNRSLRHTDLGMCHYIYAQRVKRALEWGDESMSTLLRYAVDNGVEDEVVVKVDWLVDMNDIQMKEKVFNEFFDDEQLGNLPLGGYEVLQVEDAAYGRKKGKRVAKVVVFRSPSYCILGNPMGDRTIRDYYFLSGRWEEMFSTQLGAIRSQIEMERAEQERIEAEREAKLQAEQMPLIEEWQDRLIEHSKGLSLSEADTVTRNNIRTMLNAKFPGSRFTVGGSKYEFGSVRIKWEDGPTPDEVEAVVNLFYCPFGRLKDESERTPWRERFGLVHTYEAERKMSTLTKARILQQLSAVSSVFKDAEYTENILLDNLEWMMLHAMGGVSLDDATRRMTDRREGGGHLVTPSEAVRFIFKHTSFCKPRTTKRTSKRRKA